MASDTLAKKRIDPDYTYGQFMKDIRQIKHILIPTIRDNVPDEIFFEISKRVTDIEEDLGLELQNQRNANLANIRVKIVEIKTTLASFRTNKTEAAIEGINGLLSIINDAILVGKE